MLKILELGKYEAQFEEDIPDVERHREKMVGATIKDLRDAIEKLRLLDPSAQIKISPFKGFFHLPLESVNFSFEDGDIVLWNVVNPGTQCGFGIEAGKLQQDDATPLCQLDATILPFLLAAIEQISKSTVVTVGTPV